MWGHDATLRDAYAAFNGWLENEEPARLRKKQTQAEGLFRLTGITFNVYGESGKESSTERLIPFDIIPRIISAREWSRLSTGITQRVQALNAFLHDIYHRQEIIRSGRLPADLVTHNEAFLPKMLGVTPPGNVYTHVVGIDLIRTGPDEFFVLEDNARTPSGVSYMLENRATMLHMFPELFSQNRVQSVENYPRQLYRSLAACAPTASNNPPTVAVLTPGIYNSAYYEHSFLADKMGVELVEGHDLRVLDGRVAMRTTRGYKPIDVLYRRVDDDFLDPLNFRTDSTLRGIWHSRRVSFRWNHNCQCSRHWHC